jgi:hypothetical protein
VWSWWEAYKRGAAKVKIQGGRSREYRYGKKGRDQNENRGKEAHRNDAGKEELILKLH